MSPSSPGATYSWSVIDGPGSGTFSPSNAQSTEFEGTVKGQTTVKVVVNTGGCSCDATQDLVVIEINDLPDVADQFMDRYYLTGTSGATLTIPYSDPDGDLRRVRILPPEDASNSFEWYTDFEALVDHFDGNVDANFYRDGVYLVETLRVIDEGEPTEVDNLSVFVVHYNAGDGITEDKKCKDGPTKVAPKPTGDLVLICSSTDDNNYLVNARLTYSSYQDISSVNGTGADSVVNRINAYGTNHTSGFSLLVVDHGNVGVQCMCAGRHYSDNDGKHIDNTQHTKNDLDAFTAACKNNNVTAITFSGCCVAKTTAAQNWLQQIANDAGCPVTAFTAKTYYVKDKKFEQMKSGTWVTKNPQ